MQPYGVTYTSNVQLENTNDLKKRKLEYNSVSSLLKL